MSRFRVVVPLPNSPVVDVVVPVRNAERDLAPAVRRLRSFLRDQLPFSAQVTIADRASTDASRDIATSLAAELPGLRLLHLNERSRGRALAAAWMTSAARIVACIDVDRLPDLSTLLRVIAPVLSGHRDMSASRGITALRADVARRLVPAVVSRDGLFDVELRLRAGWVPPRQHPARYIR